MNKKFVFFVFLIALINITHAQVTKETFDKAVNYLNCKSVELALKKSTGDVLSTFQNKCPCSVNVDYGNIIDNIPKSDSKTIDLSEEIETIKNNNEFSDKLSQKEIVNKLTVDVFSNQKKYQKLFEFAEKRRNDTEFNHFISQLKIDLNNQLSTTTSLAASSITDTNLKSSSDSAAGVFGANPGDNQNNITSKSWFDGFTFQIDIFSIILSIILFFIILKLSQYFSSYNIRNQSHSAKFDKKWVADKIDDAIIKMNNFSTPSDRELRALKDDLEKLKSNIKELNSKIDTSKSPSDSFITNNDQSLGYGQKSPDKPQSQEIIFLSTPNPDGSFNDSSAQSSYKEGASIYKFTKTTSYKAEFQIDDRIACIKLALEYPDKNIDPVCEAVNAFNSKAKRIITVNPGIAELSGDKWKLNRKARIRYEN